MIADAIQGKAVDECPEHESTSSRCGYRGLRCLNGGNCSLDGRGCICPIGWLGPTCEIRQCPCNPCQGNGSTCVMGFNDQMICMCALGRAGAWCELEMNVTRPHFEGSLMGHASYLILNCPPVDIREHFEIKFHFVTDDYRQVAILLFIGRTNVGSTDEEATTTETSDPYFYYNTYRPKDFLAVSFIRGHVALTWDLGSGTRRIFTATPVSATQMGGHSVHVGRRGRGIGKYIYFSF